MSIVPVWSAYKRLTENSSASASSSVAPRVGYPKTSPTGLSRLKLRLASLTNRLRRSRGPAFRDQCAKVIMHTCSLQLERGESRELAPTRGATGPMVISGGAITTIQYVVFDLQADKVDKSIKQEPWRAFSRVTMRVTVERDPEFEVLIDGKAVEPKGYHKEPGVELIKNLAQYFPLLPKVYLGPVFAPEVSS